MNDELLKEFLAESWENLTRLDSELVTLEQQPSDVELISSIFRTIHTIKGTCGFIGLEKTGQLAHSTENVLGKLRDGKLTGSAELFTLILKGVDGLKAILLELEATGNEPDIDHSELIKELNAVAENTSETSDAKAENGDARTAAQQLLSSLGEPFDSPVAESPQPAVSEPPQIVETKAEKPIEAPQTLPAVTEQSPPAEPATPPAAENEEAAQTTNKKNFTDLSIRVNVDVLDSLMNLVGELVLTRNQLLQLARLEEDSTYTTPITQLNRVTTDLQDGVMKTRMQPIGDAWRKLPRLVRDLSRVTGRQIALEMTGAETELDRTVLESIQDPLTHMVRNSADHGIELPADRLAKGKPEIGTIHLNAYHEGGYVVISISDDGAGINADRVLQKAIDHNLVTAEEAQKMSQSEILPLIFHPGFSTAEQVSSVSGRGVGMDVVRTAIDKIGGTVELASTLGQGTEVKIKIPLTLAIISALIVQSGEECFAIPQLGVVELVRLDAEARQKIEYIHNKEVFRLRDRLLPLVYLNEVLNLDGRTSDEDDIYIVVVQVGETQLGLIVSEVFDTEEIVVKPVGTLLQEIPIYQGTTILGDGRVIMILDITGIAVDAGGDKANSSDTASAIESENDSNDALTNVLLFDPGNGSTMAVPLSLVSRLEEFPSESIERSGDQAVIQYRDDLLPLQYTLDSGNLNAEPIDTQPVIVFAEGNKSMGIMVKEIRDIIEEKLEIRMKSQRTGVLGTAIINEKATDLLDTQYYISSMLPDWYERDDEEQVQQNILVVDDSLFFRQLVSTALESNGFQVSLANSADEAISLFEHGHRCDLIVSDIEMPGKSGFEFAEWLRNRPDIGSIPLIALTTLSSAADQARAMDAGFNLILKKFNSKQLLDAVNELTRAASLKTQGVLN